MIGQIRLALAILAALAAAGSVWAVMDLRARNADLRAQIADQRMAIDSLEAARDQLRISIEISDQNAARQAARAAALKLQLEAYQNGDCDPSDPACAVEFINRVLRSREDHLP